MKGRFTLVVIVGIAIVIWALSFSSNRAYSTKIDKLKNERSVKSALQTIIDSTGNGHSLINSSLRGKVVVINVWAMWCEPCRKEIPELNALVKDFSSYEIVFIALNDGDSLSEVKKMKKKNVAFDYQLLFGQSEMTELLGSFKLPNEANAIPMNMVINPEGKLQFYYFGNDPEKLGEIRTYLQRIKEKG